MTSQSDVTEEASRRIQKGRLIIEQGSELRTYINSVFNLPSEREVFTSGSSCWSRRPRLLPSPPSATFSNSYCPDRYCDVSCCSDASVVSHAVCWHSLTKSSLHNIGETSMCFARSLRQHTQYSIDTLSNAVVEVQDLDSNRPLVTTYTQKRNVSNK